MNGGAPRLAERRLAQFRLDRLERVAGVGRTLSSHRGELLLPSGQRIRHPHYPTEATGRRIRPLYGQALKKRINADILRIAPGVDFGNSRAGADSHNWWRGNKATFRPPVG